MPTEKIDRCKIYEPYAYKRSECIEKRVGETLLGMLVANDAYLIVLTGVIQGVSLILRWLGDLVDDWDRSDEFAVEVADGHR